MGNTGGGPIPGQVGDGASGDAGESTQNTTEGGEQQAAADSLEHIAQNLGQANQAGEQQSGADAQQLNQGDAQDGGQVSEGADYHTAADSLEPDVQKLLDDALRELDNSQDSETGDLFDGDLNIDENPQPLDPDIAQTLDQAMDAYDQYQWENEILNPTDQNTNTSDRSDRVSRMERQQPSTDVTEPGDSTELPSPIQGIAVFVSGLGSGQLEQSTGFGFQPSESGVGQIADSLGNLPFERLVIAHDQEDVVVDRIKEIVQQNPDAKIALIGHSRGGDSVVEIAQGLGDLNINVNLMIQIDSVGLGDEQKPDNVTTGVNIWASNPEEIEIHGASRVEGSINIPLNNTSHTDIDNDPRTQALVQRALRTLSLIQNRR